MATAASAPADTATSGGCAVLTAAQLEAAVASAASRSSDGACWDGPPGARFLDLAAACPEWSACLKSRFQSSNARLIRDPAATPDDITTDEDGNDDDEVDVDGDSTPHQALFPADSVLLAAWDAAAAATGTPSSSASDEATSNHQGLLQPRLASAAPAAKEEEEEDEGSAAEGATSGSCGESYHTTSPMNCSARTANGDSAHQEVEEEAPAADQRPAAHDENAGDENGDAPAVAAVEAGAAENGGADRCGDGGHSTDPSKHGHHDGVDDDDDADTIRMVSSSSMSEDLTAPPVALRRTSSAATDPALATQRLKLQSSVRGLVSRRLQSPLLVSYVTGSRHPMIGFAAILAAEERKFREAHPDVNHESLLVSTADIPRVSNDRAALAAAARTYNTEATVVFNARQRAVPRSVRFSGSQLDTAAVLSPAASVDGSNGNNGEEAAGTGTGTGETPASE